MIKIDCPIDELTILKLKKVLDKELGVDTQIHMDYKGITITGGK